MNELPPKRRGGQPKADPRVPRGLAFSDAEWAQIKADARDSGAGSVAAYARSCLGLG